jgi:hypothetical protein
MQVHWHKYLHSNETCMQVHWHKYLHSNEICMQVHWHKYLHSNESCMQVACVNVWVPFLVPANLTFTHVTCMQVSFECKYLCQCTCMQISFEYKYLCQCTCMQVSFECKYLCPCTCMCEPGITFLSLLVQGGRFSFVIHHFPERGHCILPQDRMFGLTQKLERKRENLYLSGEWYSLVQNDSKNFDVICVTLRPDQRLQRLCYTLFKKSFKYNDEQQFTLSKQKPFFTEVKPSKFPKRTRSDDIFVGLKKGVCTGATFYCGLAEKPISSMSTQVKSALK